MPPHDNAPGSAADWLIRAKSDLAIAKAPLPEGALYKDLCFHAQQALIEANIYIYEEIRDILKPHANPPSQFYPDF